MLLKGGSLNPPVLSSPSRAPDQRKKGQKGGINGVVLAGFLQNDAVLRYRTFNKINK